MDSTDRSFKGYIDRLSGACLMPEDGRSVKVPVWLRFIFALLGGACVFLAFPEFDQFWLAYFALALELWAIEGLTPKKAFFLCWLAGSVTNIGGFHWIGSLLENFGHMPFIVAMLLCAGMGILQGLVFGIWGYLVRKINARSIWISATAAFVGVEAFFPMLFPWYYANSQYNFVPAVQTADIFGVLGVTFLLVLCNVLIFDITRTLWLRRTDKNVQFNRKGLIAGAVYIAFAFIYAPIRMAQIDAVEAAAPHIKVGMVEADVGIWESEPPEKLRNNLFLHHSMTKELSQQGAELVVWPESSYQQGVIWGSRKVTDYPLEHEIDALYADWFQPTAHLVYTVLDSSFGVDFHKNPAIHTVMMKGIGDAAAEQGWRNLDSFYPGLVSGYPVPCSNIEPPVEQRSENWKRQIMKCPYKRLVPDDLTYYLPSVEPMRESRKADLLKHINPEDIGSPLRDNKAAILFGTLSITSADTTDNINFDELYRMGADKRKLYNTAHLIESDGRVLGTYHKNYPLMFGEYVPLADKFPIIYEILPEAGNLTAGESFNTLDFHGYKIGPIICYEDILPRYVRDISTLEPNFLVNVTNDAWFGKTSEQMLHLAVATMRTVEHRMWLVRSTNTGISAFVDPNGRMVQRTSKYEPEILLQSVGMMPGKRTIYSYIGDILGWCCAAWTLALLILRRRESRKHKS